MEEYAVVKINHRQYIIEPNKTYTVDKFEAAEGDKVKLEVLAYGKGEKFEIGAPMLEKATAEIEVIEQGKDEKINTFMFKAKSRYRKRHGHRPRVTTFKVLAIK
jgi:ribosomal protein L21